MVDVGVAVCDIDVANFGLLNVVNWLKRKR